eukprot:TRINITY_DN22183_c0_g1_i1.p3 TRINITY_DN22183_c0_g1~~TRINITY_DN22183_c0_g1_i1.p3  ORF type:complete len:122 (+),score=6.26 TRINITY_DN22183_c0_g1_i1:92-457(+)
MSCQRVTFGMLLLIPHVAGCSEECGRKRQRQKEGASQDEGWSVIVAPPGRSTWRSQHSGQGGCAEVQRFMYMCQGDPRAAAAPAGARLRTGHHGAACAGAGQLRPFAQDADGDRPASWDGR